MLDQDKEMASYVDLEGSNTYLGPLEGEDEVHTRSIMN